MRFVSFLRVQMHSWNASVSWTLQSTTSEKASIPRTLYIELDSLYRKPPWKPQEYHCIEMFKNVFYSLKFLLFKSVLQKSVLLIFCFEVTQTYKWRRIISQNFLRNLRSSTGRIKNCTQMRFILFERVNLYL